MTVKEKLVEVLQALGFVDGETIFLQGRFPKEKSYPDSFVTFFISASDDESHYNNRVHTVVYTINLFYYSNKASEVNTVPAEIIEKLNEAGFVSQGEGNDALSDEPTHTGWQMQFLYKKFK